MPPPLPTATFNTEGGRAGLLGGEREEQIFAFCVPASCDMLILFVGESEEGSETHPLFPGNLSKPAACSDAPIRNINMPSVRGDFMIVRQPGHCC